MRSLYLYRNTFFYCTSLYWALQVLGFLQIEGRTVHQQKDYSSLYLGGLEWPTLSPRYACIMYIHRDNWIWTSARVSLIFSLDVKPLSTYFISIFWYIITNADAGALFLPPLRHSGGGRSGWDLGIRILSYFRHLCRQLVLIEGSI